MLGKAGAMNKSILVTPRPLDQSERIRANATLNALAKRKGLDSPYRARMRSVCLACVGHPSTPLSLRHTICTCCLAAKTL